MAHEIRKSDTLLLAGKPAWHGLGTVLPDTFEPAEALRVGRLDWTVEKVPLRIQEAPETTVPTEPAPLTWPPAEPAAPTTVPARFRDLPKFVALRRSDTREVFAVVKDTYEPAQNADLAGVLEGLAGEEGVRLETAGSLRGGRDVFFLARTGNFGLGIGGADEVVEYAFITTAHDGSRGVAFYGTDVRVVCANTKRMAEDRATDIVRARHTKGLREKLSPERLRTALLKLREAAEKEREAARALAARPLTTVEIRDLFTAAYQASLGRVPTRIETEKDEKDRKRFVDTVAQWLANMDGERQREGGLQGTAWAAYNAVSEWGDHDRKRIRDRTHANLFGSTHKLKAATWDQALALV